MSMYTLCILLALLASLEDVSPAHTAINIDYSQAVFYTDLSNLYMVMKEGDYCFYYALTSDEKHDLLNPHGIGAVEHDIEDNIDAGMYVPMLQDIADSLASPIVQACTGKTAYEVQRF